MARHAAPSLFEELVPVKLGPDVESFFAPLRFPAAREVYPWA